MKKLFISLSFILALATTGLQPVLAAVSTVDATISKSDERTAKNFNGVAAGGPISVIITLGSTEGVRFEGDADAIATLITEVKGNILIIRPQNSWTSWSRKYDGKKITAYVSAKTLTSLTMSGSGSMSVTGKIKESGLAATLSGSGSITASVEVNDFNGVISGSGNLNISGNANEANVVISGSGSLTKKGLSVDTLSAQISGSGAVNVNVEDKINAVISGSGSVNYSGDAKVDQTVMGSGRVRKI